MLKKEEGLLKIPSSNISLPSRSVPWGHGLVMILEHFACVSLLPTVFFIVILFIPCSIEYLENTQQLLTAIVKKVPLIAEKSKWWMRRLCFLFSEGFFYCQGFRNTFKCGNSSKFNTGIYLLYGFSLF